MEIFAEQTRWHRHKPDLLRTRFGRTALNKYEPGPNWRHNVAQLGRLMSVTRHNVAFLVKDPQTGFVIKTGWQEFVHLTVDKIVADRTQLGSYQQQAITSMRDLAEHTRRRFLADARPEFVMSVTHQPLARLAIRLGFRYFVPDQTVFTDEFRALSRRSYERLQKEHGVNVDKDSKLAIIYMPIEDLDTTYGKPEETTMQDIQQLCQKARTEMAGSAT